MVVSLILIAAVALNHSRFSVSFTNNSEILFTKYYLH